MYGTSIVNANFGQDSSFAGNKTAQGNTDDNGYGDFYYAPPTGYLALCTANLTLDAAMDPINGNSPQDYFNTVLYTGNGSTQSITGVGFQPDWCWIKKRAGENASHCIHDAVRGAGKRLKSDSTVAEYDAGTLDIQSFDSDGFSLGGGGLVNQSTHTYAAWNWKANGSGVSNTDGSITSTVSANTDAGFSIVSYTGTGANATVGHGLLSAPDMIIVKNRDSGSGNWLVYHSSVGAEYAPFLNSTIAPYDAFESWQDTSPTNSVFYIGTFNSASGENHIAYCFHSVEGFSKFGSYTGNGSTDGPFVYTGFRPAFVMVKITSAPENWTIFDDERSEYNLAQLGLYANLSNAEATISTNGIDMVSNGFKLRGTGNRTNGSGYTYIYMAFAENPFKYANAR